MLLATAGLGPDLDIDSSLYTLTRRAKRLMFLCQWEPVSTPRKKAQRVGGDTRAKAFKQHAGEAFL